jgi:hypothetical protein
VRRICETVIRANLCARGIVLDHISPVLNPHLNDFEEKQCLPLPYLWFQHPVTKGLFLMENGDSTSFEGSADEDGMDSSGCDERTAPVATTEGAEPTGTADLTEFKIKTDDFVEEFLFRMEHGDSSLLSYAYQDDMHYSGVNERNAPAIEAPERTADSTEAKIRQDVVVEEFQPLSTSSDPSEFSTCISLPLIEDRTLAPNHGINRLDHAPTVEPMRAPGQRMVVADSAERPSVMFSNHHDVASGSCSVSPSSDTPTRRASPFLVGSHGSAIGFVDESSKEEEDVPHSVEGGLYIVEAHRVPDVDEEGKIMVAEAHHVVMKWYQRPLYRRILVGSTVLGCGLLVVVIILIVRPPAAAASSSSLWPSTVAQVSSVPPTPLPIILTPEQIACNFLSIPNVTECRSKVMFDSYKSNDTTTGFTIPSEIGLLTQLTYLDFYGNQLTSKIPSEIGLLSNLTLLSVWNNQLTSTIPNEIMLLTNLVNLDLLFNQLTGTIPNEIALMTLLARLDASSNQVISTIPTEIGLLTHLTFLSFYGNKLSGTIPSEIGLTTQLSHLDFTSNQLTSTIPSEIGLLTYLTYLYLASNRLSGTIPSSLCSSGSIPIWIDCGDIACGSGCCRSGGEGYPSCG